MRCLLEILFIADIVGRAGRRAVFQFLPKILSRYSIDFVLANGENAAGGLGITPQVAEELVRGGVDLLTSGNHVWEKQEILSFMESDKRLIRPANYPEGTPGSGTALIASSINTRIGILNLEGRVFMKNLDCPFLVAKREIEMLKKEVEIIIVDFHAEATSEKVALGWFLDGEVSAVIGTHTHVQTADEKILPKGTAYITDVGMTGPIHSIIGMKKEVVMRRFLTQIPRKFEVAKGDIQLQGVIIGIDNETGKSTNIERINITSTINGI